MPQRFRHSVRFKLLLVSLTLLGIPWAGYRFIIATEQFLRQAQNQNLQSTANAMAQVLARETDRFDGSLLPGQPPTRHNLYLHHWTQAPVVDGYADEWPQYDGQFAHYRLPDGSLGATLALGEHAGSAYLLLRVDDRDHRYGQPGDEVDLSLLHNARLWRLRILPQTPGWVIAERDRGRYWTPEPRIRGEWQETGNGFVLELRMPLSLLGNRLSLGIRRASDGSQLLTARLFPADALGRLVQYSPQLAGLLRGMTPPGERAWVVDKEGLVLARAGQLDTQGPLSADQERLPWVVQKLILAVLPHHADTAFRINPRQSRLAIAPVDSALAGRPESLRRRVPDRDAIVVSTAVPIRDAQGVVGAVLIEQTTNAILSIQNLALQRLFLITLVLFIGTSLALLGFASLLTARIRRLRNQLDQAVSHDGRILGSIQPGRSRDEIGELGRGFAAVLKRLHHYNHYLEAMASRLAHELRTPLSVVRTSLDNARLSDSIAQRNQYLERAHGGAERLELILQRLREATRLEQALQTAEPEVFALDQLLKHQVESFRELWPGQPFELRLPRYPARLNAVPDLISQALDKLVGNAVDFATPDTPIRIELAQREGDWELSVNNQGPALPPDLDLFNSMVSGRTGRSEQPHLGLGLYLVRLIAEFHGGRTFAESLPDRRVKIGFSVPEQ